MVLPILIDTSDLMSQYTSLSASDVNDMLDNVAKGLAANYAATLEQQAQQHLHQTRKRYIQNIKVVDSGKMEGTVLLDYSKDKLVQMLEEGASAFDMKEGMLASPKVKIGKNGKKYLTIPMRMATPGAVAESDVFAGTMPQAVYDVVKSKPAVLPVSGGGKRSVGIKLSEIPEQFQAKSVRPAIVDKGGNVLFKQYESRSSLYEGVSKYQDNTTGQNTYRKFRRVSENSADEAWVHPGIEKYNLIQKALGVFNIPQQMSTLIDSELAKRGLI